MRLYVGAPLSAADVSRTIWTLSAAAARVGLRKRQRVLLAPSGSEGKEAKQLAIHGQPSTSCLEGLDTGTQRAAAPAGEASGGQLRQPRLAVTQMATRGALTASCSSTAVPWFPHWQATIPTCL